MKISATDKELVNKNGEYFKKVVEHFVLTSKAGVATLWS